MSDDDPRITRRTTIKGALSAAAAAGVGAGALAYTPQGAVASSHIEADRVDVENVGAEIEELTIEPDLYTEVDGVDDFDPDASEIVVTELIVEQDGEEVETVTDPEIQDEPIAIDGNESGDEDPSGADIAFEASDGAFNLIEASSSESTDELGSEVFEPEGEDEEQLSDLTVVIETVVNNQNGEEVVTDETDVTFEVEVLAADVQVNTLEGSDLNTGGA